MIRVKDDSVRVAHLSNGALLALMVADQVYASHGYECVITSGADGWHSLTSLHYDMDAIDLRTKHMQEADRQVIADEINERLGLDFDVIYEPSDNGGHIHIEKQPRRRDV